jgi:hypothetical protein
MESSQAAVNAARSIGDEPVPSSQVRVRNDGVLAAGDAVERACALGEPLAEALSRLASLLAEEERHPALTTAWRGLRAMMHETLAGVGEGRLGIHDAAVNPIPVDVGVRARLLGGQLRQDFRREHPELLRWLSDCVALSRLPAHEQPAGERRLDDQMLDLRRSGAVSARVYNLDAGWFGNLFRRRLALVRCLRVLLALEQHRQAQGRWPAGLEELRPLLGGVLLDPYDGRPLRYRRLPDGVAVYSVGADGTDDGGNIDRVRRTGLGVDVGYRLWDVAKRRQPPAPPAAKEP